jgi:hypothetical protein
MLGDRRQGEPEILADLDNGGAVAQETGNVHRMRMGMRTAAAVTALGRENTTRTRVM